MEATAQISLRIDGQEVVVPEGVTILEAARRNGIRIPTLCHHEALSPYGGCRLCVVEVDGAPRLVASCVMPVRKGMEVVTLNERIIQARRTILEFLFAERNHYCMFCAQSGDCELQNLAYEYQMDHLTVAPLGQDFPVDTSHEDLVLDHNRCVLCGRCVRACRELAGAAVLDFQNRGGRTMIGVDLAGQLGDSSCASCGLCVQVCPTGAIFSRHRTHYAVKGKPKDWREIESWCPECGLLCPAVYSVRGNNLLKIEGKLPSETLDRGQLCRKGRFEPLKSPAPRLLEPLVRDREGNWRKAGLSEALDRVAEGLKGGQVLGLASSRYSNEELSAFKEMAARAWPAGRLDTLDGQHFRTVAAAADGDPASLGEAPWPAILEADLILQIGASPSESQPIICSLIRRAIMENKAKLAVIGPENALGPWASVHLPAAEGDLNKLVQALLHEADPKAAAKPDKKFQTAWAELGFQDLAALLKGSSRPVIVAGQGLTAQADPKALKQVIGLARAKRGARLIVLKPWGNSAGAWGLGLAASQSLNGRGRFKAALACLAGEEVSPDSLAGVDFLAALTPYFSEALAGRAQVLIPKPTWLEEDGTYSLADGSASRFKIKVLEPPPGVEAAGKTLAALAERLKPGAAGKAKSPARPKKGRR